MATLAQRLVRMLARIGLAANAMPFPVRLRLLRLTGAQVGDVERIGAIRLDAGRLSIGDHVMIGHGAHFEDFAQIDIGDRTWIASRSTLLTATHAIGSREQRAGEWRAEPIKIGRGCWLGGNVTVLAGVTIGDGCVVGAGALVIRDCEPNGLYVGVPATRRRDLRETTESWPDAAASAEMPGA